MVSRARIDIFNKRTAFLAVFLFLFSALISTKLFIMQVVKGAENRKIAESQHSIYRKLLPSRGEISLMDKATLRTVPVATNIDKFLVYAVPGEIANSQLTSQSLASALNLDALGILNKVTQQNKKYVPIKKNLSESEQQKIKDLKLPGIYFDAEETRVYPEGTLLSQTLGFVGYKENTKEGLYGLERFFQKELAGQSGSLQEEKDSGGAWIFGSQRDLTPAEDGINLILTIDKSIQFKAESVLKEAVIRNEADSGSMIISNPKTGAILAMANYPDFSPNEYGKAADPKDYNNASVVGSYEPGSVFKAFTMAAAIDAGKITPDSTYIDTGSVNIDGYTIKNSDGKAHGLQTMIQALDESLNTGAIYAKDQIGNDSFLKYLKNFGFGKKTGIELSERVGDLSNLNGYIKVNFATASFGQGLSVTPIQLIQAYNAFANGGKMMRPFLVQSKIYANSKTEITEPEVAGQPISSRTAGSITAMLVDVIENGHGKKAGVPGYYLAGKTGTAQVAGANGKYQENNNIGTFLGFGPVEDPQFVMLVRIDHPRDVKYAESTAAPAWGQMAQFILNYYHLPPTRPLTGK